MVTLITDSIVEERLQRERQIAGADRYDEVWEGTYMMAPMPNDEHQQIVNRFAAIFQDTIDWPGHGDVRPGVNVSDRVDDWEKNYRVPDVAVFLKGGIAVNYGAFWQGGPDFCVEVISRGDHARKKLPFYAQIGVREVLLIDRDPWKLELWTLENEQLVSAGEVDISQSESLHSNVISFDFGQINATLRPHISVTHHESGENWLV